jgi:hypothetical protein
MARILLMISLAAASLAAKDRAWQTGQLLDKDLNPYIRTTVSGGGGDHGGFASPSIMNPSVAVSVNVSHSNGDVAYDDYVVACDDAVYLVEFTHLKTYKAPHLSLSLPLNFAVEKNKLWIKDLDGTEYGTQILKQVQKDGSKKGDIVAAVQAKPAPAAATVKQDAAPAKAETAKAVPEKAETAKAVPNKTTPKPDPFATASVQTPAQQTPSPAVSQPAAPATPKPAPKEVAVSTPVAPAAKPTQKPEPAAKPENAPVARASAKDRAWQGGRLLSIVDNHYFFNVTYSSDSEGSGWPFVQGSDGRYTVNGQIGIPTNSPYTYDNYVIESQFCVYLVQRMRPKTSPPVRLPGAAALKFAVEKAKLWVLDEENIEYETKVVKLVQKDAIVDPLTRAAAR